MYSINYLSIIDLVATDECPLCKRSATQRHFNKKDSQETNFFLTIMHYIRDCDIFFLHALYSRERERRIWPRNVARHRSSLSPRHPVRFFVFSPRVRPFLLSREREPLVCGARLREPKRVFSDLSGYNRDSLARGRFVSRALAVEPNPSTPLYAAARVSLSLRFAPDARERRYERRYRRATPGRYLSPPPPPPSTLCSIRVRHCAASRSPDYRDKQPEKPR